LKRRARRGKGRCKLQRGKGSGGRQLACGGGRRKERKASHAAREGGGEGPTKKRRMEPDGQCREVQSENFQGTLIRGRAIADKVQTERHPQRGWRSDGFIVKRHELMPYLQKMLGERGAGEVKQGHCPKGSLKEGKTGNRNENRTGKSHAL